MINLPVDESYALDYLSILMVKVKMNDIEKNRDNVTTCYWSIEDQIGSMKIEEIIQSQEYAQMMKCNEKVFRLVEQVRYGEQTVTLAKKVDNANMERYYAKQELQKKFFNKEVTEVKS